jgi:hypothetical protein
MSKATRVRIDSGGPPYQCTPPGDCNHHSNQGRRSSRRCGQLPLPPAARPPIWILPSSTTFPSSLPLPGCRRCTIKDLLCTARGGMFSNTCSTPPLPARSPDAARPPSPPSRYRGAAGIILLCLSPSWKPNYAAANQVQAVAAIVFLHHPMIGCMLLYG